jgi:pentatricopeptide repeat protein
MNIYAKCQYVVVARKVFDSMTVMDFISWNAMIAGQFEKGDCNIGLELFLTMLHDEVQPNLRKLWDGSGGKAWDNYCWPIR